MPIDGLSLVGFMARQEGCTYLAERCFVEDSDPAALSALWAAARDRLGPANRRAGKPEIRELPDSLSNHLEKVRESEGFEELTESFPDVQFALVEIGPLLAYQPHVETARSDDLCRNFAGDIHSPADLAEICLPAQSESFTPQVTQSEGSVIIHSESLNLRVIRSGLFELDSGTHDVVAGVYLGMGCPLLHVARFEGRYFLRNGFHRVYGLQKLGVTHMPCVVVPARHFEDTGALGSGMTFGRDVLLGDFAPTCAHLTDDRALPVHLRKTSRVITAMWAESLIIER